MSSTLQKKSGAALVIVLGFLAILTVIILAFSARTRSARLSGRSYLDDARSRQLLEAAAARAMHDLHDAVQTNDYPQFFAVSSEGDGGYAADKITFPVERDFLPLGNERIRDGFDEALETAQWQTATADDGTPVGRYSYVAVNVSGLLDVNEAGGLSNTTTYIRRTAGRTPSEIQLARDDRIVDEFHGQAGTTAFPLLDEDGPAGTVPSNIPDELAPGYALVHNRDRAWKRFETLRDLRLLGNVASPDIFTEPIASFSTFSFDPASDPRMFMGTNSATLNEKLVEAELRKIDAVPDRTFVMNQLRDYLDTDNEPQDENGAYTDYSVEPTPLLNELVLECNFSFEQLIEEEPGEGDEEGSNVVSSVIVSNSYSLMLECWHPFTGSTPTDRFGVAIMQDPIAADANEIFSPDLLGDVALWETDGIELLTRPDRQSPEVITMYSGTTTNEISEADGLEDLFEEMLIDITFPSIICSNLTAGYLVDRVQYLDLQLEVIGSETLLPQIENLGTALFDAEDGGDVTNIVFTAGMAVVDPRLNWNGQISAEQWMEVSDSTNSYSESMGAINADIIESEAEAYEPLDRAFVRNTDRIDSPYELTYLLQDPTRPWQTFQMLEAFDEDNTRRLLQNLTTYPDGPPKAGRINPYTPHRSVIAAAFMDLPIDEFNQPAQQRMNAEQADAAAGLFMDYVAEQGWPDSPATYGDDIDLQALRRVMDSDSPWELEAFFRNSYELFNPRDVQFMLLLAAQDGTDTNQDGLISDDEVSSTQTGILHIWMDPASGRAARVFFGLGETMQTSLFGPSWEERLQNFEP